jgi:hypothetical protein
MKGDANVASAREKDAMKILTTSAIALSVLGFASGAQAQQAKLSFEGDMVRGAQAGAPGPFCVLNNQFKHLEKVVFRFRMLDAAGKPLDKDGLKSLVVELPDGQKLAAQFGQHPPRGDAQDHFWTAIWMIPANYPNGTFVYKAVATASDGSTATWEPFKTRTSQLQVVEGAIEIKPPAPAAPKQ